MYTLIVSAQKLKPYFETHPVEVDTDQLLRQILENPMDKSFPEILRWLTNLEAKFEVYPVGWGPLLEVVSGPTIEVCHPLGGVDDSRGDARGYVWKPHQWKSPDAEDPTVGNILAFCSQECQGPCGSTIRARGIPASPISLHTRWLACFFRFPSTNAVLI
ncbi:hypothetical protein LIER_29619 [Lithospermum erythrorhizon]|uniref:Uncharacterized protein n=1 Tax=Lithospermum erythrorhizon TaxID=34254 RepID=A0AAV3RK83_LITER